MYRTLFSRFVGLAFLAVTLLGLSSLSYSQTQVDAVDDVYNALDQTTVTNPQTLEPGYILSVPGDMTTTGDPLANDTYNAQSLDETALANSLTLVSGQGTLIYNTNASVPQFEYYPGTQDGNFPVPAVFTYALDDVQTQAQPDDTAQITINPPPQPEAVDDTFDANDPTEIQEITGSVPGQPDYQLLVSPLDNDTLAFPAHEQGTCNATGNFTLASGNGSLVTDCTQGTLELTYVPSEPFTQTVVFNYFLADSDGLPIAGTNATITITPPAPVADAVDDTVTANENQSVVDPATGNIGYQVSPLDNDTLPGDPSQLDLDQTEFTAVSGVPSTGSFTVEVANNNLVFTYYPGGAFTEPAVFDYTLFDSSGNAIDNAQLTINPPGTAPQAPQLTDESDLRDVCQEEAANQRQPAICQGDEIDEGLLSLSTIRGQADAMFGMKTDFIRNIRQRMSENRNLDNRASVAGLNSNLYGKQVPIGRIAQELLKPLTGGSAGDDLADSGRLGFFINGNFQTGDRDESDATTGYDQDGFNISTGIDYRVNRTFIVGAALSMGKEDTEFNADRGEQGTDTASFTVYGNYFPNNSLYADFLFMLTQGDIEVDRNVNVGMTSEVAHADTDSDAWAFAGTGGYHWNYGAWEMDGYGRVEFTNVEIDGYTENGSSFDLTVSDQEVESLEAALGFKVARVFSLESGVMVPSLDVEWIGQFDDDVRFVGVNMEQISSSFSWRDEGADNSYFNAALSLSSVFASGFSGYLRVESQFGDEHLSRTTYGGGLRWEF